MAVREGLLALLREGPSHGYQLKTAWETATGGVWSLNVGQVYTTLDRLARDGSVEVSEVDGQKQYAITAAGREELQAWWETGPADVPPPRDELMLKVLMAIEDGFGRALEVITDHRSALTTTLQPERQPTRPPTKPDLAATPLAAALATRPDADR